MFRCAGLSFALRGPVAFVLAVAAVRVVASFAENSPVNRKSRRFGHSVSDAEVLIDCATVTGVELLNNCEGVL